SEQQQSKSDVTPERLMGFAWGYAVPLIIESAIRHRVFDVLDQGPKTLEQVSGETKASQRGLRAILDALVSIDLARKSGLEYSLAPESAKFLVSTKQSFQGGIFKHVSTQLLPKWIQLSEVVATGKPAAAVNRENSGAEFFQQFVEDIFPMSYA